MIRRQLCLQGLALLVALAACTVRREMTATDACHMPVSGGALQDCLDSLPPGAVLALPAARLVLTRPLTLRHAVALTTADVSGASCREDMARCAALVLRIVPGGPAQPAITIAGAGSVLDHLVIEGGRTAPPQDATAICNGPAKPSMGSLAVTAPRVTIRDSVMRDAVCYSAVVVGAQAGGFRFERNAVLSNGTHDRHEMWADGLTVIDGVNDVIRDNLFRDNTDVQLVLGGCLRCTVADNRLDETDAPGAGAFAGLLVHAWPETSGDYAGTDITGNLIDCGPGHRCGFGLGVGGQAWYKSPTSGGLIARNTIVRAQVGINVDDATGQITMRDNWVIQSGGLVKSHCGDWLAGPVNITPASRPFVDATAGAVVAAKDLTRRSFAGCLPGT